MASIFKRKVSEFRDQVKAPRSLESFIRAIRAAGTAENERTVLQTEAAKLRTFVRENSRAAAKYKERQMLKIMYLHMLGYNTSWASMEAVRMLVSDSFAEKRLGYLVCVIFTGI